MKYLAVAMLFVCGLAFGADFQVNKVSDAVAAKVANGKKIGQDRPAIYEVILFAKAVDEKGVEVTIQGQRFNATIPQIDAQIAQVEASLAKLKAMKAQMK
jgi:hypothetical protein